MGHGDMIHQAWRSKLHVRLDIVWGTQAWKAGPVHKLEPSAADLAASGGRGIGGKGAGRGNQDAGLQQKLLGGGEMLTKEPTGWFQSRVWNPLGWF